MKKYKYTKSFTYEGKRYFVHGDTMREIGEHALPILSLCFVSAGISITLMSLFQAVGDGVLSMIVSITRQLVVLIPAAWLLSKIGLHAVWYSFVIAEGVSLILVITLFVGEYRKRISPLFHA